MDVEAGLVYGKYYSYWQIAVSYIHHQQHFI